MKVPMLDEELKYLKGSLEITERQARVTDKRLLQENIHILAEHSAIGEGSQRGAAQYIIRQATLALGAVPSSINDLYLARGRGEVPFTFTVPAMNLRMLAFDSARIV
ncbi:MAG TPA: hypothetical protein VF831_11215, partial [Anaerolineales bacterium]